MSWLAFLMAKKIAVHPLLGRLVHSHTCASMGTPSETTCHAADKLSIFAAASEGRFFPWCERKSRDILSRFT